MKFLKFSAVGLIILGILSGAGGSGWLGYLIWQVNDYRTVSTYQLPATRWTTTSPSRIRPKEKGQIGVKLRVHSKYIRTEETDNDVTYEPQYQYPFQYKVINQDGEIIHEESVKIKTESHNRNVSYRDAGPHEGTIEAYHYFKTFPLNKSIQSLRVKARLQSDKTYKSSLEDAKIVVYDSIFEAGWRWLWSGLLFAASGFLIFMGAICYLIAEVMKEGEPYDWKKLEEDMESGEVPDRSEQQTWATLSHLSALSMWVGIPFGNILGPLVVWVIMKNKMPFVDTHGREALNFQISMAIYSILAIPLVFIFVGVPLLIMISFFSAALALAGTLKAMDGEMYRYPITIRFL
ncbi:MAG: DUF4870 domain-containing protein [bacterium]